MKVFRLTRRKYASALSGRGAAKSANRWNSKGTEMVYFAESRALAMAEVAVHLSLSTLPSDYVMVEIDLPDDLVILTLDPEVLKDGWNQHPPIAATQRLGDAFIDEMKACVLKVPSAVVPGDYNYLLNPHHPSFNRVTMVTAIDFPFDPRIFAT